MSISLSFVSTLIEYANKIVPLIETIVIQIEGLIGPITGDAKAAIDAIYKALADLKAGFLALELAVKNVINPPAGPPAA